MKAAVKLQIGIITGLIVGIVILFALFPTIKSFANILSSKNICEDTITKDSLNRIAEEANALADDPKTDILQIKDELCTLVAFSKGVTKKIVSPDAYFKKTALCLCKGTDLNSCQTNYYCKEITADSITFKGFQGKEDYVLHEDEFITDITLQKKGNSLIILKGSFEEEKEIPETIENPTSDIKEKQYAPVEENIKECKNEVSKRNVALDCSYYGLLKYSNRLSNIDTIILHHTGGSTVLSAITGLETNKYSAHYIVDKSGRVYYLVNENFKAIHAADYNSRSIGIEIVNTGKADDQYTEEQYSSLKLLLGDIASRRNLPYDNEHIKAHYEISTKGKWDPSPSFDWAKISLPDHQGLQFAQACPWLKEYGYICNQITNSIV